MGILYDYLSCPRRDAGARFKKAISRAGLLTAKVLSLTV